MIACIGRTALTGSSDLDSRWEIRLKRRFACAGLALSLRVLAWRI